MFLAYVSPLGRALVDKRLYLPKSWTSDQDRCAAAGVPEDRRNYRSKKPMLERVLELGYLRAEWVAGDDAFGMSPTFREGLAAHALRAGRSGRHYGLALGPGLDQYMAWWCM